MTRTARRAAAALVAWLAAASAAHAASTITTGVPAPGAPLQSAPIRNNFNAAATDINNILGMFAGSSPPGAPSVGQDWLNTAASPAVWNKWTSPGGWAQIGTINLTTGQFSATLTSASVAATAPVTSSFSGGVVTVALNIDSNFAVISSNLALASVASGHLLANNTAGTAEPGDSSWTAFADRAIGNTNGNLPYRTGGAWSNISTGTSGATIPLNNSLNVFSVQQTVNLNTASLPASIAGATLNLGAADGVAARVQLNAFGAIAAFTGAVYGGTNASPTAVTSGTQLTGINAYAYNGASLVGPIASFRTYAGENIASGHQGSQACIATTPTASTTLADGLCQQPDAGITAGSPTGGSKGAGTLNAVGLYVNGTAVTAAGITALTGDVTATGPGSAAATLATAQPAVHTWALAQTFTVAPVFTDQSGSRTALGLGTAATQSTGTSGATVPLLNGNNTYSGSANFTGGFSIGGVSVTTTSSTSQYAAVKIDNSTITINGSGQIQAVGAAATAITVLTTTITGGTNNDVLTVTNSGCSSTTPCLNNLATTALTFGTGTLSLSGNLTTSGAFNPTFAIGASVTYTFPGSAATLAALNIADQTLSGGANVTSGNLGTKSSGTTTIDCGTVPLQYLIDGGAFTLAAPANDGSCIVQIANNGGAGAITLSGFSPQPTGNGDTFSTANTASGTATFSNGSANITYTTTLAVGNLIYFTTSSALPTNFAANTMYYVVSNSGTVITVAATAGGSAIVAGSAGSGTQTAHVPSVFDLSVARVNASSIAVWKQVQ